MDLYYSYAGKHLVCTVTWGHCEGPWVELPPAGSFSQEVAVMSRNFRRSRCLFFLALGTIFVLHPEQIEIRDGQFHRRRWSVRYDESRVCLMT